MRAGYPGRMSAAIGGSFSPTKLAGLSLWLDSSDSSTITKAYQNIVATGTGTSGASTITASGSVANLVQPGMILRIGGTDTYTVVSVATVTITISGTLINNYVAQAMALDKVSQWNDKSGFANHVTQATTLKQPIYNPAQLNSQAVLTFDGASSLVMPAALYTIPSGNNTIFSVSKINAESGAIQGIVFMVQAGVATRYNFIYSATVGQMQYRNGTTAVTGSGFTNTNYNIIEGRRSGTTEAIAVNNAAETTNTSAVDGTPVDSAFIGANNGTSAFLLGQISRLLIYNRSLALDEITRVNRFLAQGSGITIS